LLDIHVYWNILTMHGPINVKSPNNTSKWQMEFNSAFKGLSKRRSPNFKLQSVNLKADSYPLVKKFTKQIYRTLEKENYDG
jgi:hypothetical protein